MSTKRCYYETLEVERNADETKLKSAFRKLAMKWHPDKNPGDATSEVRFKEINEAYEVLKDGDKRAAYDRFGHAAFEQGMGGGGPGFGAGFASSFSDIFEDLFGMAGQRRSGGRKRGGLFETAFGMTLGEVVNDIGGGTASGRPVKAVQVGGPLGAYMPMSKFDTPMGYEEFDRQGGLIGHAGLVVFDDSADMLRMARFAMEFCAVESCGKCTPCRIGAVRGVETIDRIAQGDAAAIPLLTDLCETMKDGSLCALGGFTPFPVMSALTHFPDDFATLQEAAE